MPPQLKLGILQLGQARFFRLAYLVHTGQQDCGTFGQYLRASHPTFDRLFPDFAEWLDRYDLAVLMQTSSMCCGMSKCCHAAVRCFVPACGGPLLLKPPPACAHAGGGGVRLLCTH
jgi:hypothetical protein